MGNKNRKLVTQCSKEEWNSKNYDLIDICTLDSAFFRRNLNAKAAFLLYSNQGSIQKRLFHSRAGLPDFSWCMIPKPEKCTR
jgi:hypothetical protein